MPDTTNHAQTPPPSEHHDALLRLIADSVPALMAYFDLPGLRCRFANQGYAAFNGHSVESILGLTVREAIGERAWRAIEPHVERCMQGERVKYVREQTLPKGEVRVIEVNLIPHVSGPGQLAGAFVLITDITERWRAENAVRQSEERMRKFAEATEEGLAFHRDGRILDANASLQRMTGYTLAELVGRSIFDFIQPEYRALAQEYTRRGREYPYELAMRHKDGHAIPIEAVGKTLPQQQDEYRVVVVRDITARKQPRGSARAA